MKINVKHLAKLANLPLTKDEEKKFEKQLSSILEYVEKLERLDLSGTNETSQVTGLENIEREDISSSSFSQEKAIGQANKIHNGFFEVDAILEE